jgi:hypothetical protein
MLLKTPLDKSSLVKRKSGAKRKAKKRKEKVHIASSLSYSYLVAPFL